MQTWLNFKDVQQRDGTSNNNNKIASNQTFTSHISNWIITLVHTSSEHSKFNFISIYINVKYCRSITNFYSRLNLNWSFPYLFDNSVHHTILLVQVIKQKYMMK